MDIKSKNIRYSLGTKMVAVIILWASMVTSLGSGFFLLLNIEVLGTNRYEKTHAYQDEINRLIHNTVELGTKFKHGRNKGLDPARYKQIEYNLSNAINFNYYIKNLERDEVSYKVVGGIEPEAIKDQPGSIYISKDYIPDNLYYQDDISNMLIQSPQDIYIWVSDPLAPGDEFYEMFMDYTRIKTYIPYAIGALIGSMILLVITFGHLILVSGRKEKGGEIYLGEIDRIYNDIQSFVVLIAALISMVFVSHITLNYGRYSPKIIIMITIFALDVAIGLIYFFSMLRQFKKGVLFKNTLVWKVISKVIHVGKMIFNEKIFNSWILGLMLIYAFMNGMLFILATGGFGWFIIGGFFMIIFNLAALGYVAKRLKSLMLIMDAAKEISNGNLDYELDQSQIAMEFESFASNIQSIQGGLKNAVNEAIKGERMKTDLITNVSHDLKTPLTSIINYVDLLKQEELNSEAAKGYIDILDEKSYRLKQLIEDLIEASKASSGNLTITTEAVDLHELVNQACGEYQEKINEAQLELIINAPQEKVLVLADGKFMWRIIENIMSNALKYSMKNSRIYVDIGQRDGYGILTMKNMSAYPLDVDPSELIERFTRGDESRTTEGSGLGLSIAQSLTSLQGGHFNVAIDGDLFKVTISIPITN